MLGSELEYTSSVFDCCRRYRLKVPYPVVFQSLGGFLTELNLSNYTYILTERKATAAQTLEYRVSILFPFFLSVIYIFSQA